MKVPLWLLLCFPVPSISVTHYYKDTMRGPRDFLKPKHPGGKELLRLKKAANRGDSIFEVDKRDQFSRCLLLTQITSFCNPDAYTGPQELTSRYSVDPFGSLLPPTELIRAIAEHLVEVSPTFEFVKKVLGDEVGRLGDTLDVRWLIIENMKYSIDRGPPGRGKEYFDPFAHLKQAVGSGKFPDNLVLMTKELNEAKALVRDYFLMYHGG